MELSVRKTAIIILIALGAVFWAFEKTIAVGTENLEYVLTDPQGKPIFYDSATNGFLIAHPSFPSPLEG